MIGLIILGLACDKDPDKPQSDAAWEFSPIYGVPNVDDDNEDGVPDGTAELNGSEDDLEPLELDSAYWVGGDLILTQNDDGFRVYENGELIMNSAGDERTIAEDAYLEIEFLDYNTTGSLTLSQGSNSAEIQLQSAPLIINHHLQPAEMVYAMSYMGGGGNGQFINGLQNALGDRFTPFDLQTYGWDVWIQDEIEFGTLVSPSTRIDVVIDSIRDRGLDPLAEAELEGSGIGVQTWGNGWATSQDSFGNLEASPPVTVNGVEYPFGRVYYGDWRGDTIHQDLTTFLDNQTVQAPVQLDVTWLCVGHVDEFSTFVPDPASAKGFKLLVTDTEVGYEFFESLEAETTYCSDSTYSDQDSCEAAGMCSDSTYTTQADCEATAMCSDGVSLDEASCLAANGCSDGESADQATCEAAGMCSDGVSADQATCEAAGMCSDGLSADQATCEAAGMCSDSTYTTQADCESNTETWTAETWSMGTWTTGIWTEATWTAETWTAHEWNSMSLPKYSSDHNYDDVNAIISDTALRALNEDIQMDYIEPNIEIFKAEFGLTEDDIIRIPMLFEEAPGCGSYTATLLPGTVNMIVAPEDGTGEADLIMPDPYFRSIIGNQSTDPFIEEVNSLLPDGSRPHWIDDWEGYHMALGEVHCGSNTKRTPTSNWYESALHLLGGE